MLLLLLDSFDGHVLILVPVDLAANTLVDLGALKTERVILIGFTFHDVLLGEESVGEVGVL